MATSSSSGPDDADSRLIAAIIPLGLFRLGDFRCLGVSMLFNAVGMMGEVVVLGWLTLELTNSPFIVGVAMGTRMLPLFFVGVLAGALADRFPRHRLLMLTGAGQTLTAGTLGALTLLGVVSQNEVHEHLCEPGVDEEVVYLLEGRQLSYGRKAAWDAEAANR